MHVCGLQRGPGAGGAAVGGGKKERDFKRGFHAAGEGGESECGGEAGISEREVAVIDLFVFLGGVSVGASLRAAILASILQGFNE